MQEGFTTVSADDLVTIEDLIVYKENLHRLRLKISTMSIAVKEPDIFQISVSVFPNPFLDNFTVGISDVFSGPALIILHSLGGIVYRETTYWLDEGMNQFTLPQTNQLSAGIYIISIKCGSGIAKKLVMKL